MRPLGTIEAVCNRSMPPAAKGLAALRVLVPYGRREASPDASASAAPRRDACPHAYAISPPVGAELEESRSMPTSARWEPSTSYASGQCPRRPGVWPPYGGGGDCNNMDALEPFGANTPHPSPSATPSPRGEGFGAVRAGGCWHPSLRKCSFFMSKT